MKKALIAMSGGVDSSVAAKLMQERGYDCIGCTMDLFDSGLREVSGIDPNPEDARVVCEILGIPFHIVHLERDFREQVVEPFAQCYEKGQTPNPCVRCNRCLKFGCLFEKMKELGCDVLVTGHYARVVEEEGGEHASVPEKDGSCASRPAPGFLLKKALDLSRDQSYFLYSLTQEQLSRICFPLGELTKEQVRGLAFKYGFHNAKKHDSQDICFVPDGDYAGFISRYRAKYPGRNIPAFADPQEVPAPSAPGFAGFDSESEGLVPGSAGLDSGSAGLVPGDFVDRAGRILGRHKGILHYTIGQRRGLGIPAGKRIFVVDIEPETNTVVLGDNEDLFRREITVREINLIDRDSIPEPLRAAARIRSRHEEQPALVRQTDSDTLQVIFDEPQRAPTPGQSLVLYDGDTVIGGGIIVR